MSRKFILFFVLFLTGVALGSTVAALVPLEALVLPPLELDALGAQLLAWKPVAADLLEKGNLVVQPVIAPLVDLSNEFLLTRASYWKSPPAGTALPLLAVPAALLVAMTIVVRNRTRQTRALGALAPSKDLGRDRPAKGAQAAHCGEPAGLPFWWVDMATRLPAKPRLRRQRFDKMRPM